MMEDPEIGSSIEEMRAKQLSFDFSEEAGFNFCRDRILLNSRVQGIIRALESDAKSRYTLAYRGSLPPDPGHICTLRNGGEDLGVLIVQLWPKASNATFHSGSHAVTLTRIRAANNLWEVASKQLKDEGCKAEELQDSFQEGGLVLFDARISFERKEKRCYYYTYVSISLLEQWQKMQKIRQKNDIWGLRPPASQNLDDVEKLGVYVRSEKSQEPSGE